MAPACMVELKTPSLTSQTQPTPVRIISVAVCDTESDLHWGWLGLACETKNTHLNTFCVSYSKHPRVVLHYYL